MSNTKTKKLSDFVLKPEISFDSIFNNEIKLHEFKIDCSKLEKPNYIEDNLSYVKSVLPIIHKLMSIDNPCIYWFEAENENIAKELISHLDIFRNNEMGRKVPPKNKNRDSKCLYIGIRQGGIRKKDNFSFIVGRIAIHLGYYHVTITQGLNLAYWAI